MKNIIEVFRHNTKNGVVHHLAATTFFVKWQDQPLLKAQGIYSARKKDKFSHLSDYQKNMN